MSFQKSLLLLLFIFPTFLFGEAQQTAPFKYREIWGYLMKGEEKYLHGSSEPLTDIAYFSAQINEIGRITEAPDLQKIPEDVRAKRRIHLVISTPANRSLLYWCLGRDMETREGLISDLLRFSQPYDGLQLDFESIRTEDKEAYWGFIKELKARLPKHKILSVALPARTKETGDAFSYTKIGQIADRLIIMAYDEHWRTGSPGVIASAAWCEKICNFAKQVVPVNKLIMGIPLYGRVWQKQEVARPLKYFQTLELLKEHPAPLQRDADGTPPFAYQQTVDAVVYFEDIVTLKGKLSLYQNSAIQGVAFWRISQEPAALWQNLKVQ